jgi:hypothetical protein
VVVVAVDTAPPVSSPFLVVEGVERNPPFNIASNLSIAYYNFKIIFFNKSIIKTTIRTCDTNIRLYIGNNNHTCMFVYTTSSGRTLTLISLFHPSSNGMMFGTFVPFGLASAAVDILL